MTYNVKHHHAGLAAIQAHMCLTPLAVETEERQSEMLVFWDRWHDEFSERIRWPTEKVLAWKLPLLARLVDWAFETCPFYRTLYGAAGFAPGSIRSYSDFEKLPMISKDDLIAGFPVGIPSERFDIHQCRWMSTSGSSGKSVQIVLSQERANHDILFKYRMFEHMAGARLGRNDWLYNVHYVLWWHTSMLGHYRVFSVTQDCPPEAVAAHLKELRPFVVSTIGSYLDKLATVAGDLGSYGVRVVSTNSETTSRLERQRWSATFGVPVCDEYSSDELDLLAAECAHGSYHSVEDDTHLEIIEADENGLGEVVGTDLWNYAMPIIRYRQADLAEWEGSGDGCRCGSGFRRIKNIHGRADQAFLSRSGETIAPGLLLDAVEEFFCSEAAGIAEFRVIQTGYEEVTVLYVVRPGREAPATCFDKFGVRLATLFRHFVAVTPLRVEAIPKEKSYKRRTLINRISG